MTNEQEQSPSGDSIYRHQPREHNHDTQIATPDEETTARIEAHLRTYVGDPWMVFHELVSDLVHIDVHIVQPTTERPFFTLVTSGMSARPMHVPEGLEHLRYAEVLLCLPADWKLQEHDLEQEENYWPIRWLKIIARLPHTYETWLCEGHTIPNGDPPEPFAANTELCGIILASPVLFDEACINLPIHDGKTIRFLSLLPLYREEMDFKLMHGADLLFERLEKVAVSELLDLRRVNVCRG
jgi:hypothetical protein